MTRIRHTMILASAGSGKTYALTNRYVRLLALGVEPPRIVALTFTRKAAGEFFDEILKKLARAATEPEFARELAQQIGAPACGPGEFLRMLRQVADAMPRLRLETLDSFFAQIVRAFPLELGLAGDFEILEEHTARTERARVLRRLFGRTGAPGAAQREFIEAFKRATFGAEEKRPGELLHEYLDKHQQIFLEAPDGSLWGNPRATWPKGCAWLTAAEQLGAAATQLRAALPWDEFNADQRARLENFLAALPAWSPGAPLPGPVDYLVKNAFKAGPDLAQVMIERRKVALPPAARDALRATMAGITGAELARRLEMTRGIHAVLAGYDAVYHETVRRAGRLTFGDVQRLLEPGGGARRLSAATADASRLAIDYRLDGEFDHWLLDEFQDTSFGQWSVLRNLIDEVVQEPGGTRSFFYVGDVKQAIFAWREGDPKLFREIFNSYNARAPGAIEELPLAISWRSGKPVIDTVNAVFGAAAAVSGLLPGPASTSWNAEWKEHGTAKPNLGGHAALLHAAAGEGDDREAARFAVAVALLREIDPLARGLSCALLVKKNETAAELADFLRREGGWPATAESDLHVCTDNPPGAALLALAKVAAHPGDTLAWEHVRMTPLGAALAAEGLAAPEDVTRRLLGDFHAGGFERTLAGWAQRIEPALAADDAFSRERRRQFAAAAARFDATGSRDVAEFVQFMERQTVRDTDTSAAIRVMTMHKAKGLGFDLVILPDLEGRKLDQRRKGLAVQRDDERAVRWVLDLPTDLFQEAEPVLAAYVREAEADAGYEALSLLYVAMTRAKRAMYLVVNPPGESTSHNYPRLLADTLGREEKPIRVGRREFAGAYAAGDPEWHLALAAEPKAPTAAAIAALPAETFVRVTRRPARRAATGQEGEIEPAKLFTLDRATGTMFGTAVHALLAEIEWGDGAAAVTARWQERPADAAARDEALACLHEPALAAVWARPDERAQVWRERAFDVVLDEAWVSGVCDRVVLGRDARGRATRATVFDFKTERAGDDEDVAAAVARHAPQMNVYRRVVATLTGLPPRAVECALVFTRPRRLAIVPADEPRKS